MRRSLLGAFTTVLLGGCGGPRPAAPVAPVPGPGDSAPVPSAPSGPLRYRAGSPVTYQIERYDSLFYASMPGAPQATAKRGILVVRPLGRSGEVEVRLDSLAGLEDTRLTPTAIDSSLGSRWQLTLTPSGPQGPMSGGHPTILSGQVEAIIRLLFPQLPRNGLGSRDVWADSTGYRLQLDAFDSFETASRNSQTVPGAVVTQDAGGATVEAVERLSRRGTAMQGGQTMILKGTGLRRLRYEFSPSGWVRSLTARDSLELMVTIGQGDTVAVRWRSTLIGSLRDLPLR